MVGRPVGSYDGDALGETLGLALGLIVGLPLGLLVGSQTKLSSLHIATSLTPKHLSNGIQSIISSQQLILVEYMCSDVTHEEGVWVSDERQDCDGKST